MPTQPNLTTLSAEALTAELARREAEAERKQAEAEAAWKAEQAKRARAVLDGWQATEDDLIAAEKKAQQEFHTALLEDPMVAAYIRYRWHRYRRAALRSEAQAAAHLLGEQRTAERITNLTDYGGPRLVEDLTAVAEAEAMRLAAEESEAVLAQLNRPEDL